MTGGFDRADIGAVLIAAMLLAAFSLLHLPSALVTLVLTTFAFAMVAWIAWQDFTDLTIPDGALIALAAAGAAHRLAGAEGFPAAELGLIAIDAALCGGALLLIREVFYRVRGIEGIGFGDVKLAAAGGVLIGVVGFSWALFLASVAGLLAVFYASLLKPQRTIERLPFGTFLAPACWCVWIAGF